jgi:hypothetical protein
MDANRTVERTNESHLRSGARVKTEVEIMRPNKDIAETAGFSHMTSEHAGNRMVLKTNVSFVMCGDTLLPFLASGVLKKSASSCSDVTLSVFIMPI